MVVGKLGTLVEGRALGQCVAETPMNGSVLLCLTVAQWEKGRGQFSDEDGRRGAVPGGGKYQPSHCRQTWRREPGWQKVGLQSPALPANFSEEGEKLTGSFQASGGRQRLALLQYQTRPAEVSTIQLWAEVEAVGGEVGQWVGVYLCPALRNLHLGD